MTAASLSSYVASTATPKNKTKKQQQQQTKNCRHRNRCPRWASRTARSSVCDVIMSANFRLVEFALHVLHWKYPKNERNKIRLTLAPNRGSLGMLWTFSGSVVVLSWDLTHKNTQTSTQAHACRSHSDPSSLDTNTLGSPCPRIKHTLLHKDINLTKNIPVNLTNTAIAALPFLPLTSKCSI